MMRISKLADYGTIIMVYFANCDQQFSNARDIAHSTHLNIPTVSKLLKLLTADGLLKSLRGINGGYCLQRDANKISIADIIYAVEKQRGLTECSTNQNCSLHLVCNMQKNWQFISRIIENTLANISLTTLATSVLPTNKINIDSNDLRVKRA